MCGFHEFKQGLPAGLLPSPGNRLESRVSLRLSLQVLLGRLQRLSPDTNGRADEEKTTFHTTQGSYTEVGMLRDIKETFCTLCKINMKLNPKKCTFGAVEGMFLGYTITPEGMKLCPDKIEAVLQLSSPQIIKELPLLVAPKPKEELIVYLLASYGAISAVLMTKKGTVQTPVYFVRSALQGPELNYTPMERLVLSLFFAAKRVRRYIQAHPIVVITDQLIKQIISRPDVAGWLQKWSVMLGEHNITYRPRTSVKGQILADFLVEKPDKNPLDTSTVETPPKPWTLFIDGSSCIDRSGVGLILTSPEGTEFTYALWFQFTASNNEAQYEALIVGLRIAAQMGVRNVQVSVDSKLVANQVLGTYVAKEENMIKYLEKVKSLVSGFAKFSISQEPRGTTSRLRPYHFTYLERELTMEEMLYKFIDEGKREHEEMREFICDFQTINELLFKERNSSLIELIFGVQELFKVIKNVPMIDCEVKGLTTRGGKTTTQDVQDNNINVQPEEPPVVDLDKMVGSNKVLTKNQPEKINEYVVQPSSDVQTPLVPFLKRLRKEKEEAQLKKFLENLNNSTLIFRLLKPLYKCQNTPSI
ncbi:reverse transcriptase domain-containing protein [Tanacetum coccineum]